MNDRDEQRRKRREGKKASSSPAPFEPEDLPDRPTNPCDEPIEREAVIFYDPEGCPVEAPPPDQIPAPLVFGNEETTLECSDVPGYGPIGDAVTVPKNTFTSRVYFQLLTGINTAQLTYIASLPTLAFETAKRSNTDAEDLQQLLRLEGYQAQELVDAREAAEASVALQATNLGVNQLDCYWLNQQQTATCPPGAFATNAAPDGQEANVRNPIVIPAGETRSTSSQADANERAANLALSRLRCLWGNTLQTADCSTHLGYEEPVPNDEEVVGEAGRLRVGTSTVTANSVFSDVDQADADSIALQLAIGQLDCFYINEERSVTCPPDVNGVASQVDPIPSGAQVHLGERGNPATVAAGYVESATSTAEANEQALVLAQQSLECFWYNDEVTVTCPQYTDSEGNVIEPDPLSPTPSVTVAAGEVISYVSKAAADEEALLRAQLQLDCLYCSVEVPPRCPPNDYTWTTLPIPLSEVDDTWSLDATLGAPAGLVCSASFEEAQSLAESVANVPIPPVDPPADCNYGNQPVVASCTGNPVDVILVQPIANPRARGGPCLGGADGTASSPYILPVALPAGDQIEIALFEESIYRQYLSSQSYPNPFAPDPEARKITIARNTFIITDGLVPASYAPGQANRAQLYANELAAAMAVATLDCFFSNCPGNYLCHGAINDNVYNPPLTGVVLDIPTYGTGTALPTNGDPFPYAVSSTAYGSVARPVFVQEGQFISYVSPWEVQSALNSFLRGTLDCFWLNDAQSVLCGASLELIDFDYNFDPGDGTLDLGITNACLVGQGQQPGNSGPVHPQSKGAAGNPATVGAGIFRSYVHPNAPNIQAIQAALAQLFCFYTNNEVTVTCDEVGTPSTDGPDIFADPNRAISTVCKDTYFSSLSQGIANAIARQAAIAGLACFYESRQVSGSPDCAADEIAIGPTSLAQGAATSGVNSDAATDIAKAMLEGMQRCYGPDELGGQGEPGNDGAQTGCRGNCYGYFS